MLRLRAGCVLRAFRSEGISQALVSGNPMRKLFAAILTLALSIPAAAQEFSIEICPEIKNALRDPEAWFAQQPVREPGDKEEWGSWQSKLSKQCIVAREGDDELFCSDKSERYAAAYANALEAVRACVAALPAVHDFEEKRSETANGDSVKWFGRAKGGSFTISVDIEHGENRFVSLSMLFLK
jgi:hypothetical protein